MDWKGDANRWEVVRLWDLTGKPTAVQTFKQDGGVIMVGFLPDGKRVVSADDFTLQMWDIESGEMLWYAKPAVNGNIKAAALSPDGTHILSYGYDVEEGEQGQMHGQLKLLSANSGKLLRIFHQFDDKESSQAFFSPDGKRAYIDGSALDIESGEVQQQPAGLAVSPDGNFVISETREGTNFDNFTCHLVLRATGTGKVVRDFAKKKSRIAGLSASVRGVSFSPDGKYVTSVDDDEALRRWDVQSGQEVWSATLENGDGSVFAFSADGRILLTASAKLRGSVDAEYDQIEFRLWDAATGKRLTP